MTEQIYCAAITHRHGSAIFAARSEQGLHKAVIGWVDQFWDELPDDDAPDINSFASDFEAIEYYFKHHSSDTIDWDETILQP